MTVFLAVQAVSSALARVPVLPVISTFDVDTDGWMVTGDATSWEPSGGNGGGYLRGQGTQTEDPPRVVPPPAYLGDWASLDGRSQLRYDHRVLYAGNGFCSDSHEPYTVTISGPGGIAVWQGEYPPLGTTDWVRIIVPIDRDSWTTESGDWIGLIADVTDIDIKMELFCNLNPPDDQSGLDNIVLEWICPADLAPPFGLLDLADVNAFISGFVAMDPLADLDQSGLFDLADINLFIDAFVGGCP